MLAPFDPDQSDSLLGVQVDLAGRRFLLVSTPFGPFGRRLAQTLEQRGARVSRMLFNAGDALIWRRPGGIPFRQAASAWPDTLRALAADFTDIVVFGEGGPYNQGVLSHAANLEARVWVLENGYFRPDWVTVERDGVNASSRLPREAAGYDGPVPELPVTRPVGKILPYHVLNISLYHVFHPLGAWRYPRYQHPYTASPWSQFVGHVRRYLRLTLGGRGPCSAEKLRAAGPYFLVCLQREGDSQLLRYSPFPDNAAFLAGVMDSFARQAPAGVRLVVKNHPLDPGLIDLPRVTRRLAEERGIADRVSFIDGGNLARLCRASSGLVVNNSSAALSALGFGTPVKVLGRAFFDFEGLTDQKPLDAFWRNPRPADHALFTRFRAHVIVRTQINGNYHEPRAIGRTARALADVFARG